jgi:hypothetical protein
MSPELRGGLAEQLAAGNVIGGSDAALVHEQLKMRYREVFN